MSRQSKLASWQQLKNAQKTTDVPPPTLKAPEPSKPVFQQEKVEIVPEEKTVLPKLSKKPKPTDGTED